MVTRIALAARIGFARCALQIDVGFGDVVTPAPQTVAYPTLLNGFEAPTLRVYPVYTVVAEKYRAMVMLGQANSRMKDFYDLAVIARRTALPSERPLALTRQFGDDPDKQRQRQAFLNKNRIAASSLADTVALLNLLLWLPTELAVAKGEATTKWQPEFAQWV